MERHITLPLTEELARTLHAGDTVYLTGTIYTSRDAGHKRMCETLERGEPLPFDPKDATIYYVGPTPRKAGAGDRIGRAPPPAAEWTPTPPTMMSVGARGDDREGRPPSGSGGSHEKIQRRIFRRHRGSRSPAGKVHQGKRRIVDYEDLGAEALRRLYVEEMPLVVIIDCQGNNLYEQGRKAYLEQTEGRGEV